MGLDKDCPLPWQVFSEGRIVEIPQLGGLHFRYERIAAMLLRLMPNLHGPRATNVDVSVFNESLILQFRAEALNLSDHVQCGIPVPAAATRIRREIFSSR